MKATVSKRVLVNAVNSAALAVGRRAGLPILRCLKLEVEGGCVTVRATDLAVAVTRYLAGAECDAVNGACAVGAAKLIAALKAVTALEMDRSKPVKFEAGTAGDCIVLSATNTDMEAATQRVRVSGMDRPIPTVGFNAKYLIEALGKAKDGAVEFAFAEYEPALTPILLMDVCDPHWRYVLMPMRITN